MILKYLREKILKLQFLSFFFKIVFFLFSNQYPFLKYLHRSKQICSILVSQNEHFSFTNEQCKQKVGYLLRYGNDGYGGLSPGIQNEYEWMCSKEVLLIFRNEMMVSFLKMENFWVSFSKLYFFFFFKFWNQYLFIKHLDQNK